MLQQDRIANIQCLKDVFLQPTLFLLYIIPYVFEQWIV